MTNFGSQGIGSRNLRRLFVLITFGIILSFILPAPLSAQTVVMSGLDNPRGLTFGHPGSLNHGNAALYVAEAGTGGTGPCLVVRGQLQCVGATGAVSRLWKGEQERIVTGLPSYAPANGAGATGPHDVSFSGGRGYVVIGLHGAPSLRSVFGNEFGWIVRFRPNGNVSYEVDVTAYEEAVNPGGGPVDSDPYGLLAGAGRDVVVESGGNVLLGIDHQDEISTLAILPSRPQGRSTDSVTTAVATGPDGAYYVAELSGAPFAVGAANIYRLEPGQAPQVFLTGFTAVLDLDFDRDGNLYVLQHATGPLLSGFGSLIQVAPDGTRTTITATLTRPTSVAMDADCNAYVSNFGTLADIGEVLRFEIGCSD